MFRRQEGFWKSTVLLAVAVLVLACGEDIVLEPGLTTPPPPPPATAPPPPPPPEDVVLSSLAIVVSGLPQGAEATVTLQGPDSLTVVLPADIDSLSAGSYVLRADPVVFNGVAFVASPPNQEILLVAGEPGSASVSFTAQSGLVLPPHPRVWMTADRVQHLKAQMSAGTERWQRVYSAAEAQLAKGTDYTSSDANLVPALCAVFLATDDARFAQRAGTILTNYAVPATDLKYDSGYGFRFALPVVTMGLDWCHAGLTESERRQVATWLMDRADWVWPETNPDFGTGNKRYAIDRPSNNYWWGFSMTGPAALAAAGDDTGSHPVSGFDRAAYHTNLALVRWSEAASLFMNDVGLGGGSVEGSGYDVAWYVGRFADAFLTSGVPVSNPWLESSLQWRLHSTMPGGEFLVPFGDQARVSTGPLYSYDRLRAMSVLPAAGASSSLKSQIQFWLDWIGETPYRETGTALLTEELLRYDPDAPSAGDLSSLPLSFLVPGPGYFVSRSSWTDPLSTAWALESGHITEAHRGAASNSFLIWKGEYWISANANVYSHSGIRWESQYHNTMTIGGEGQRRGNRNEDGVVARQESAELQVVRAQAAAAYGRGSDRPISDFLRTVSFMPDLDVFVVVDRIGVRDSGSEVTLRWHAKDGITVAGQQFVLPGPTGQFRCFGTVEGSTTVALSNEAYQLGTTVGSGNVTSNAVAVSSVGEPSYLFVTVFQCGSMATRPPSPTVGVSGQSVTVAVDGASLTIPLDESLPVTR